MKTHLETSRNRLAEPDLAYRLLIEAHRGLSASESAALNARLILVLAQQIGDTAILREAIAVATSPRSARP